MARNSEDSGVTVKGIVAIVVTVTLIIAGLAWAWPTYHVWHQHMIGAAELAKAEYTKKVLIQDAMAREESAKHLASAEVERAKGAAESMVIISDKLNDLYLHSLWLQDLGHAERNGTAVIYVATEAGIPITEAGRFGKTMPKLQKPEEN